MSALIIDQLIERLSAMPDEQQKQVLDFAHSLGGKSDPELKGKPFENLWQFAGTIPADDLEIMRQAIKEDCGKIDTDEW